MSGRGCTLFPPFLANQAQINGLHYLYSNPPLNYSRSGIDFRRDLAFFCVWGTLLKSIGDLTGLVCILGGDSKLFSFFFFYKQIFFFIHVVGCTAVKVTFTKNDTV